MLNEDCQNLRECPFCGGEAEHRIFEDNVFFVYCRVTCSKCGATLTKEYTTGNEGIVAWNRRVNDETDT